MFKGSRSTEVCINTLGLRLGVAGTHFDKSPSLSEYDSKRQQYCLKGMGTLASQNQEGSAAKDKEPPLQLSRQGKGNSSEGKHRTEACCDLFNGSTDFRDSDLKVLEGEKGTGRRKKCWKGVLCFCQVLCLVGIKQ